MRYMIILLLAGCTKIPQCECREVITYTQYGTNTNHSWQEVGDYEPAQCKEWKEEEFSNFLKTVTERQCNTQ
jgi:hypothetical protein